MCDPEYKALGLIDGNAKQAVGYVYETMDEAKEQIKENLNHNETRYRQI